MISHGLNEVPFVLPLNRQGRDIENYFLKTEGVNFIVKK
jgi:hypothetical protein